MPVVACIRTRILLAACVAALVLAESAARAAPVTMPMSGFNVELAAGWSVVSVRDPGDGGAQMVERRGADVVVVFGLRRPDCGTSLALGAGEARHEAAWLRAGWSAKIDAEKRISVCSPRAGFSIVLVGKFTGAPAPYAELLASFERAWLSSEAAQLFEVVVLPMSTLTVRLPPGLRLVDFLGTGSPWVAGIDVLRLVGKRVQAEYQVLSSNLGCDEAVQKVAAAVASVERMTPSTAAAPAGWRMWTFGTKGRLVYCASGPTPTAIVISPGSDAIRATGAADPTALLLASLRDELLVVPPPKDAVALAVSKWRVRLPLTWKVASGPAADGLIDGDNKAVAIVPTTSSCDALMAGDTKDSMRFDPAWMPEGWRATLSIRDMTIILCATVDGGVVQAGFNPTSPPRRRELIAVLESLRRDNLAPASVAVATTAPSSPAPAAPTASAPASTVAAVAEPTPRIARPLMPFPIRLAYQTVGFVNERGHGIRLGLDRRYGDESMSASLHGELGYDSLTKLGHDVQLRVAFRLLSTISALGAVGHDGWGTGEDAPTVPHGLYGGLGAGLASVIGRALIRVDGLYLWRSADPVAGLVEPDVETRLRLSIFRRFGPIQGLTGELRSTGEASTLLIGAHLRL